MARAPKSREQLEAEGTFRPDRHAGRGVDGVEGELAPPPHFDGAQVAVWREVHSMCVVWVTPSDAIAVEAAALALYWYRKAAKALDESGLSHETNYGQSITPAWKVMRQAGEDLRKYSGLLGLSPADRARLTVGGVEDDSDAGFQGETVNILHAVGGLKPME